MVLTSPQGRRLTHGEAVRLSRLEHVVLLCGRYEAVDERVRDSVVTEEISIGDYVVSGGELPAMVVLDAVGRLVPGVVGDAASVEGDSFVRGLLDHPHYTRPAELAGQKVPDVLMSGESCGDPTLGGRRRAVRRTLERRPDLLSELGAKLDDEEQEILRALRDRQNVRKAKGRRMKAIEAIERTQLRDRPEIRSGDTVRVHVKVKEGEKERIQVFEGIVIGLHRGGSRATFTVRKVSFGQGVERVFPLHSPVIDNVEVVRSARVRRAKLYFLRKLRGKAARLRERRRRV